MCLPKPTIFEMDPRTMLVSTNYGQVIDRKCSQCGAYNKLPERAVMICGYCDSVGREQIYK